MGVGADLHRAAGLPLVHEGVHVAHDREGQFLARFLQDRDRADVDHLVDRRSQGDGGAGHPGDPGAPNPAGDHDIVGVDPAPVGDDRSDPASLGLEIEHLGVGEGLERALAWAFSRKIVPARSESTADTVG